uniref:Augerpeptide-s6a n=1 Tax=Terebra subulata TaxID=89435 RepID=AX6A_TERSU|nr:RecName: Full=Augerpeptide-s6a; Short=Agx-s6a; Flags: Precursor [Terebra subulata]
MTLTMSTVVFFSLILLTLGLQPKDKDEGVMGRSRLGKRGLLMRSLDEELKSNDCPEYCPHGNECCEHHECRYDPWSRELKCLDSR